jgi:hypothetical protein
MSNIGTQLQKLFTETNKWKDRYKCEEPAFSEDEIVFLPIRHFNSDTPITPGNRKNIHFNIAEQPLQRNYGGALSFQPLLVGGGYYLWHQNRGIAIDPGYGFVDSLHRYHGINVHHIHAIIITHDHLDHHADLETIINLRRGAKEDLVIYSIPEIDRAYQFKSRATIRGYGIEYYPVNPGINSTIKGTNISFKPLPALHWQRMLSIIDRDNIIKSPKQLLESHLHAMGIQLTIPISKSECKRILITGDTLFPIFDGGKWFAYRQDNKYSPYLNDDKAGQLCWTPSALECEDTKQQMIRMIEQHCDKMVNAYKNLDKSDIVCLHIGSLEDGLRNLPPDKCKASDVFDVRHDPKYCYDGFHLGIMGAVRLMEQLITSYRNDPAKGFDSESGLVVLTEFGEEILGNRQNICCAFSEIMNFMPPMSRSSSDTPHDGKSGAAAGRISVLPSEITLRLRVDHLRRDEEMKSGIFCSYCGNVHDWKYSSAKEGPGEILTFLSKNPDADRYIHNCICWEK